MWNRIKSFTEINIHNIDWLIFIERIWPIIFTFQNLKTARFIFTKTKLFRKRQLVWLEKIQQSRIYNTFHKFAWDRAKWNRSKVFSFTQVSLFVQRYNSLFPLLRNRDRTEVRLRLQPNIGPSASAQALTKKYRIGTENSIFFKLIKNDISHLNFHFS